MKLVELLHRANKFYPDGYLEFYFDSAGNLINMDEDDDNLAKYIVIELVATYDKDASDVEQINEACRVLENGMRDLLSATAGIRGYAKLL